MNSRKDRGFSLLEMIITLAIIIILASFATIWMQPMVNKNHVDLAYDTTLSTLRTYRNLAITQGNRYIITATAPGTITVQLWGYVPPPGVSPAPQTVATYTLPSDVQFAVQAGFPNPGPDALGDNGQSAIYSQYPCTVVANGAPCVIFYPDGSAQDDASTPGNFNSGVVYLTRPADLYNSRAINWWGTTGRIRGWRLYNISGNNTWVQQ